MKNAFQLRAAAQDIRQIEAQLLRLDHNIGFHEEQLETLRKQEELASNTRSLLMMRILRYKAMYNRRAKECLRPHQRKRNPLVMLLVAATVFLVMSFVLEDFRVVAWASSAVLAVVSAILTRRKQDVQTKDAVSQEGSPEKCDGAIFETERGPGKDPAVIREQEEAQDKFLELLNSRKKWKNARCSKPSGRPSSRRRLSHSTDCYGIAAVGRCRFGGESAALIINQEAEMRELSLSVDKWNEQTAFIRSRFHFEHHTLAEMAARFSEIQNAVILENTSKLECPG